MRKQLINMFESSNEVFLKKEIDNILNGTNERNLCGRLAIYLNDSIRTHDFSAYYVDTEYNRNYSGKIKTIHDEKFNIANINCDIIVHSRGKVNKQDNLIALEMKKSSRPQSEKDKDRKRLKALTKDSYDNIQSAEEKKLSENVCGYVLGIYLELNINIRTILIEYYQNGKKAETKTLFF